MTVEKTKRDRDTDEGRLSFYKIRNVASVEYVKWLLNPRLIIFIVLYVFIYDYVIEELLDAAHRMDECIMLLEPFIAMANSGLLIMVIPAVFMVLISDFPKTDGNTMFYIQRVGKANWMLGQMLFGIMSALTYLSAIIFVSFLMVAKDAFAMNTWSPVVTTYVKTFPNESMARVPLLINERLYNNMTPVRAFVITVSLLFLYLIIMELLLLVGFSAGRRIAGMIVSYTVIAVGSSLCGISTKAQWAFPSAHSIAWLHYDKVLKVQKVDIRYSYLYFLVLIAVLFIISLVAVRRYDFAKITDMED